MHIIKKLWARRVEKCKPFLGAKGTQICTSLPISTSHAAPIVPSMEIRAHSRLILARFKVCTNARCILSRIYGHEEFKNVKPFSLQKAHKAVLVGQFSRTMQRRIEPTLEIRVHSRLILAQYKGFLARYKGCTNARCILSRS